MASANRYDVFLSHNSADQEAVQLLAHRLRDEAGLRPFLDQWHLIPGQPMQEAIEEALYHSETVAVFVGPSGISPWHNEQLRVALDDAMRSHDDYRVMPVLLPGATPESASRFLARRVWVDFRSGLDDTEAFARLVAGVKGEAMDVDGYELPDEPAPYRGLLRFEAQHARFFFGRAEERRRLAEKLERNSFVAVVGPSGSGKSSLVRAGLLPDLAEDVLPGSSQWRVLTLAPGSAPLRALADQLASLVPPSDRLNVADELVARLAEREDGLRTALATLQADQPGPLLLLVDQFEELFTLCREGPERCRDQVAPFVANLADAATNGDGNIRVLITLRSDFLDRCLAYPALRDQLEDRQVLLGSMDEAALREVIVEPAQVVGALFEKGLVSMILRDVEAEPGVLPLLQHALYELWRARRGPWLTSDAYEASGGVRGALERRAQATYEALMPEQRTIARNVFIRLTALGEGVSDTRRRVARAELYPVGAERDQVDAVLQALSGRTSRLVVADADSVELAHEALIAQWGTLREWLEQDREALRVHRHLTRAAQEWVALGRDPDELYRGARLAQAEEWGARYADEVNRLELEFLDAGLALRDREAEEREAQLQQELKTARQLFIRSSTLAAVLAIMVVALGGPPAYRYGLRLWASYQSPLVTLPASSDVIIGTDDSQAEDEEKPATHIPVPEFQIEKYEVSNRLYELCERAGACTPPFGSEFYSDPEFAEHPVVMVDAFQARTYCAWLGRRLPTEIEWERAARGTEGQSWPWGDEPSPNPTLANLGQMDKTTHRVDSHPEGASLDTSVFNLVGNVWEWTGSVYTETHYAHNTVTWNGDPTRHDVRLVFRGGAWQNGRIDRITKRLNPQAIFRDPSLGFRCAK